MGADGTQVVGLRSNGLFLKANPLVIFPGWCGPAVNKCDCAEGSVFSNSMCSQKIISHAKMKKKIALSMQSANSTAQPARQT